MTCDEFNEKYKDYLEKGHYGMAICDPDVIALFDKLFQDFVKIPGFEYSQIKTKFNFVCFYAAPISGALIRIIEREVLSILKRKEK